MREYLKALGVTEQEIGVSVGVSNAYTLEAAEEESDRGTERGDGGGKKVEIEQTEGRANNREIESTTIANPSFSSGAEEGRRDSFDGPEARSAAVAAAIVATLPRRTSNGDSDFTLVSSPDTDTFSPIKPKSRKFLSKKRGPLWTVDTQLEAAAGVGLGTTAATDVPIERDGDAHANTDANVNADANTDADPGDDANSRLEGSPVRVNPGRTSGVDSNAVFEGSPYVNDPNYIQFVDGNINLFKRMASDDGA